MPTYSWPSGENNVLSKISKDENFEVQLDEMTTKFIQDYRDLQPMPGKGPNGEKVEDGWIPLDLAWLAAGVAVVAIGSLTAILYTAVNKGYDVTINFGKLAGKAVLKLTKGEGVE